MRTCGKLPKRRVLRSILHDAIDDRLTLEDPSIAEEKAIEIGRYRTLLAALNENKPLPDDAREVLILAGIRAWSWRDSYRDAVAGTGDKAMIVSARDDLARVNRMFAALGVERADPFKGARTVSIWELRSQESRMAA